MLLYKQCRGFYCCIIVREYIVNARSVFQEHHLVLFNFRFTVFGFNQTSFTAEESGRNILMIQIGYIKGIGSVVNGVDIEVQEITAGLYIYSVIVHEYSYYPPAVGTDFTIHTTSLPGVDLSSPATLQVGFTADAVALEPDETFRLTLSVGSGLPSGPNVFLQDTAEFTIIDSDGTALVCYIILACLLYMINYLHCIFSCGHLTH